MSRSVSRKFSPHAPACTRNPARYPRRYEVLEKGMQQYPDSVELRYAAASVYEDQGQVGAALHELSLVLKARPEDPAAMNALGFTLADHDKELARRAS